jgi:hypothetical protein
VAKANSLRPLRKREQFFIAAALSRAEEVTGEVRARAQDMVPGVRPTISMPHLRCSWTRRSSVRESSHLCGRNARTHRDLRHHPEAIESMRIPLHNSSSCLLPLQLPNPPQPGGGAAWSAATLRGSRDHLVIEAPKVRLEEYRVFENDCIHVANAIKAHHPEIMLLAKCSEKIVERLGAHLPPIDVLDIERFGPAEFRQFVGFRRHPIDVETYYLRPRRRRHIVDVEKRDPMSLVIDETSRVQAALMYFCSQKSLKTKAI